MIRAPVRARKRQVRRGAPRRGGPRVLAFSGRSGAGKTTLLVRLIPALRARGLVVAALKRSGHPHPFDRPGKDSARLRRAGAVGVALSGPLELAYFGPPVASLRDLVALLPPCDLVLAEGFKSEAIPRVEVRRAAVGGPFLAARDPRVLAVVSDVRPPGGAPWLRPDQLEALTDLVEGFARGGRRAARAALAGGPGGSARPPRQRR